MTDLSATVARLRHKAERASVLPRDSFKPAFLDAMAVIEELVAERDRLQQTLFDAGIRADELTGRLVDAEREQVNKRSIEKTI